MDGDELFLKRIISRNSSVDNYSSRIYYYRSSEGVPFNWETQPGTPKEAQNEDDNNIVPPISPPPALLSLGLPKPCINVEKPDYYKPSMKLRFIKYCFWKQGKKNNKEKHGNNKRIGIRIGTTASSKVDDFDATSDNKYRHNNNNICEMSCSDDDGEFMGSSSSPRLSSSSSSSASFSFSNGFSFRSSARPDSSLNKHYRGCSPLDISYILDRVSRSRRI